MAAYGFFQQRIANPINAKIRHLIVSHTPWPPIIEQEVEDFKETLSNDQMKEWKKSQDGEQNRQWLRHAARLEKIEVWWGQYAIFLDMIGLIIAVILTYVAGALFGSFVGKRLILRGETLILKMPLIKQVYPSVKQVTDFLVGSEEQRMHFNRVVAVEYPRKGLWSIGLVTGDTMRAISAKAGQPCMTVFVPSSPTPFTGYVITVPREDTIDLSVSIEDALRFTVSGGVIVPKTQQILPEGAAPQTPSGAMPHQQQGLSHTKAES